MNDVKKGNDEEKLRDRSLRHIQVFNDVQTIVGIPARLFWGGFIFTVICALQLPLFASVLFALLYFPVMYEIHKDDPHALSGWVKAALSKRKEKWVLQRKKRIIKKY